MERRSWYIFCDAQNSSLLVKFLLNVVIFCDKTAKPRTTNSFAAKKDGANGSASAGVKTPIIKEGRVS